MLYIVYGTDRAKQKIYIDSLKNLHKDVMYSTVERTEFAREEFEQTVFGTSLFGESYFVVLDGVCEIQENREYILKIQKELSDTNTVVILQEVSLDKTFIDEVVGSVKEIVEYGIVSEKPDFTLWSAIYARDKKAAWVSYIDTSKKEASEKTHAGILSQIKNMYKIKNAPSGTTYKELGFAKEGGYQSAVRGTNKYSEGELSDMLYELSLMPLQAHAGECDFTLTLEKFILKFL